MLGLTKRQREIVDFIQAYVSDKRENPTYRDIQNFFGFSSLGSVYNHIQTLKRKGILSEHTKGARSLSLKVRKTIPLIGKLKGGLPIETFAEVITLPYPTPPDEECYFLTVEGDMLIEECLQHGDHLLVVPRTDFEDGQMVIALVDKQTTLVKRAYLEPPYIRFESTNPQVYPIILKADHVQIQGIIHNLFRQLNT